MGRFRPHKATDVLKTIHKYRFIKFHIANWFTVETIIAEWNGLTACIWVDMFKTVSISRSEISAGKNGADSIHIPGPESESHPENFY